MVSTGRHPKKEIAEALARARLAGLAVNEIHRGHRWGEVICGACSSSRDVYSTPRDPGTHAKHIDRFTTNHTHAASAGTVGSGV
jgi:hypothetical protein